MNCVSDGKYCLIKPKEPIVSQLESDGKEDSYFWLLEEGIRERCIYEILEDKRVKAS